MPIQLSAQQFAALQQQQMLQVMSNNAQSDISVIIFTQHILFRNCANDKNVIYRLLQVDLQPFYILNSLNKNKIRLYLPSLELFIKMYKRYLRILWLQMEEIVGQHRLYKSYHSL